MTNVIEIPISQIRPAELNPNAMDMAMLNRLRISVLRYGLVSPLVIRRCGKNHYETIGGAQRLMVIKELGVSSVPCVVLDINESEAVLLAQALNRIHGEDDLGTKAKVLQEVLKKVSQEEVLALLPETPTSLEALVSLGQQDIAAYLDSWNRAQAAKPHHLVFHLASGDLETVQTALKQALSNSDQGGPAPNVKSKALVEICRAYLRYGKDHHDSSR